MRSSVVLSRSLTRRRRARSPTRDARRFLRRSPASPTSNAGGVVDDDADDAPGLFSVPGLRRPSDFLASSRAAVDRCDALRRRLAEGARAGGNGVARARRTLRLLDGVSNAVCGVLDAAELCRCAHASKEWRDAADRAFAAVSETVSELNADARLYAALVENVVPEYASLGEEDARTAESLRAEFERDGVHLPTEEREELRRASSHVERLESLFQHNATAHRSFVECERAAVERALPSYWVETLCAPHGTNSDVVLVPSDARVVNTLLRHSVDPELRRIVHRHSCTACPENLPVLDALVERRQELARRQGFPSYAHRFLADKMAKTPERVRDFLDVARRRSKNGLRAELETLAKAKRAVEGPSAGPLGPHDLPFYTGLVKERTHDLDPAEAAPYFSLDNVVAGVVALVDRLFGVRVEEAPLKPGEGWTDDDRGDDPVRKLLFYDATTDEPLGTLYLDLLPREGKYAHAAHFTVRCGCEVLDDDDDDDLRTSRQLPVVALVCNVSTPSDQDDSKLLSHSETETLLHEFGHALHSLLSRTSYQHLSGTRGPLDFVEIPSHLFENYAWTPDFLREVGQHRRTGEQIPESLVQRIVASRDSFPHYETTQQCAYAAFDQALFSSPTVHTVDTSALLAAVHRSHGLPHADGTHWHSRFGHLVSYGAGYYGYLFAKAAARRVWEANGLSADPFSRVAGSRLRRELLAPGGARDPERALQDCAPGTSGRWFDAS